MSSAISCGHRRYLLRPAANLPIRLFANLAIVVVVAENVEVSVGGIPLLAPTSFTLEAGDALAVRGDNGSGKTTLLRVVAGVVPASSGSISVRGSAIDERRPAFRRAVASLIGLPPLARDLTLHEHLTLVGLSWGHPADHARETAERVLSDVGLARFRTRYPHELSSGQTQLFAVATVLCRPSELLILDEPEQRLDHGHLSLVARLIRERLSHGTAVLFATHDDALVEALGASSMTVAEPDAPRR